MPAVFVSSQLNEDLYDRKESQPGIDDDTAEVLLLADWGTMVSRRFAMRAVEYLRQHRTEAPPERLLLTLYIAGTDRLLRTIRL